MTNGSAGNQPITVPKGPADMADLAIVGGAGHVGLPLAISFAGQGQRVIVYDINEEALTTIGGGSLPAMEHDAEPLLEKALG